MNRFKPKFIVLIVTIALLMTFGVYLLCKHPQTALYQKIGAFLLLAGFGSLLIWRHRRSRYYREKYRVTETLRRNETRFHEMFLRHMAVMLLIEPENGTILDANPAAEKFYGYPLSRLRKMNITDINMLSPDEVARERQRALHEERQYFIFPHRLADGRIRTVEVRSSPFWFKNRPVLFSIIHDITERIRVEEALRESEQRFKTQYRNNPMPTFTWRKKEDDFELMDFNEAARIITCGQAEEYLKKKASVLYADRPDILQELRRCFTEKTIIKKELFSGHFVPGRLIDITMVPVPPDLVMVHLDDITKRRQAEEALRESEEKYRRIVELAQEGIWVIDAAANTVYVNPRMAEILGYSIEEMLGRSLFSFLDGRGIAATKEAIERRKKGLDEKYEREYIRKDGRRVQALVSTAPIMNDREDYQGAIAVLTDITERKRMEEEKRNLEIKMQQTQKLESLGILAGGIAHDFNNLLMVVLGNADIALLDLPAVSPAYPLLSEIKKVALRASDLCKQMLAYAGKGAFSVKPIDLSRLVSEMGRMLKISISKKILLHYDLAEELSSVHADAAQIRQVVMNLIINASEAIGDREGIITVRTGNLKEGRQADLKDYTFVEEPAEGPCVFLEVADTGCGMEAAVLEKIFDPFFTTKFAGRGLGLPAVLGIVRSHKGALRIESEPGKGTVFRILFPALKTPAQVSDSSKNREETWKGEGLILLVEDEEPLRDLCRRMLEHIGFEVWAAENGLRALELFGKASGRVRCVLLDLTMPVMDGGETLAELRRLDPTVPVVMCSGYNEQTRINRFLEQGLSGFLMKPYQLNDLIIKLKSVLA